MAQRRGPGMVPLADWGKVQDLPQTPVNWRRRALIGAGIIGVTGGFLGLVGWLGRNAANVYDKDTSQFKEGGAGESRDIGGGFR